MALSLADLRKEKEKPASLPTRVVKICLDQALLSDIQRLTAEKSDIATAAALAAADSDDSAGPPRRQGQGVDPRLAEIDAELEPLYERLRETEGELLISARDGGEWIRWKDAHPPRENNEVDDRLAYGLCNAADLVADLGKYIVAWNGDDFGPGEWDGWFASKVAPADLGECTKAVVEVHEARVSAPKSLSTSSAPQTSVTGSPSPAA